MGLMSWLRGGRTTGESAQAPAPADPRGADRGTDRGDRVDVSRIAPLQRTLAAQELVIGPSAFEKSLTTRQNTSLGMPLGHLVSPDAPAGLVRGVVGAVPGSPAPAVRRAVEMPLRRESVSAPVQRVHGDGAQLSLTSLGGSPDVTGAPVRRLLGEQPPVRTHEETPAPEPEAPAAPEAVQRAVEPARAPRRAPGLGAPLPGLPPTAQRTAAASTSEEPMPGRTPGPAASHPEPSAPAPSLPAPSGPPADRREAEAGEPDGATDAVWPTGPELSEAADPVAPLLGDAPPVGSVAGHAAGSGTARGDMAAGEEGGGGAGTGAPVQRSVLPSAPLLPVPRAADGPTVPLLGDRGLSLRNAAVPDAATPRAAVQRSSGNAAGASGSDRSAAGPSAPAGGASLWSSPAPPSDAVPVRWTTGASGPAAGGVGVPVQRVVSVPGAGGGVPGAPHPWPRTGLPGPRGFAGPGGLGVQRQTGHGPPVPRSVAGPGPATGAPGAFPTAGTAAVAAGVAQRMADGSVVFSGAPTGGTSRPVVQRDAEITEEPPPLPEPPDLPADPPAPPDLEPSSATGTDATPAPDATEGTAGTGAGTTAVTDELVRALYTPLSRLLKADLRLERERAGFLINTRH
ncbi:hypothetical protein OG909_16615 [Streptomyces sp. NBC_01754]|uniref:hypothetical protein n=1 Tax=Streptomyces sp. NBC_01754 TaxID=2975930 RepID=UPI002DDA2237|nr:hypothetical protein [Streptomyces sp. NBC_01754]WSC93769.1 hypothetical protein OG909_16615 [Streptomyces sp. NBC_01754]